MIGSRILLRESVITMVGRSKISDFFRPLGGLKRSLSDDNSSNQNSVKKLKLEENTKKVDNPKTSETDCLSPSVKERILTNRLHAQVKLLSRQSPALSENIGLSWFQALEPEFTKPYFVKLSEYLKKERENKTVYPPPDNVYTWTRMCDIKEIKVVMIGQDPYHNPNQAHGLCFSVQKGVAQPASLVNIFKELKSDIEDFEIPNHGDLSNWAKQGVLLLNACLTVRAHEANSHKDQGWEKLTDAVINWLNNKSSGIVFLLWGSYAQKKGICIDKKKHPVLTCAHPSPLSVHKGFFGCKHFSKANELLIKNGKTPIDWKL